MKHTFWLFAAAAAALVASTGCRAVRGPIGQRRDLPPERGGTLRLANYGDVRNLDPAVASDTVSIAIEQLLYAPLVDYDREGRLAPLLAERVDVSSDGRRYSFQLREGTLFHDGDELTADDVKRSIERALDADTPCPAPSFYASIAGYEAFHNGRLDSSGKRVFAPHLEGVVVEGRYAVRIDLSEPDATFLPALTLYYLAPVCRSAGAKYTREWSNQACGAGPFRLEQWLPSRDITLVRHHGYFRPGLPYLDRIHWSFSMPPLLQRFKFEEGDLDHLRQFSSADLRTYRSDPRWKPFGQWEPAKGVEGVFLNTQMKPFDNVELRRAFAAAVDWLKVTSARPEMSTASQVVPPAVPGHDPSFPGQRHDPSAALEHMRRAGYPFDPATGRGGYPEPVVFVGPADSAVIENFAPIMQQQVARVGIRMEIKQVSYPAYLAETGRRHRAALGYDAWSMDFPDPSDFFEPIFSSEAIQEEETQNRAFFSHRELDELLKKAHRELDPNLRAAMYRRCEEIVRDEAPWALGAYPRWYEIVQPYVHGYVVDRKHTEDVREVWIDVAEAKHGSRWRRGTSALASIRPWGRR